MQYLQIIARTITKGQIRLVMYKNEMQMLTCETKPYITILPMTDRHIKMARPSGFLTRPTLMGVGSFQSKTVSGWVDILLGGSGSGLAKPNLLTSLLVNRGKL